MTKEGAVVGTMTVARTLGGVTTTARGKNQGTCCIAPKMLVTDVDFKAYDALSRNVIVNKQVSKGCTVYANYIGPPVMTDGIRLGQVFPFQFSDQMTGTSKHVHAIEILRS